MTLRQRTIMIGLWIVTLLLLMGYMSEAKADYGLCGAKYIIYVRGGDFGGDDVTKFYAKKFGDVGTVGMAIEFISLKCDLVNGKAPNKRVRIPYSSIIFIEKIE